MLLQDIHQKHEAHAPLRICTFSDGMDAVIRLAAWIARFPDPVLRDDCDLAQALERLTGAEATRYDLIVVAPNPEGGEATTRLVQAVLDAARACSASQILLWPAGQRLPIRLSANSRIVYGPPFADALAQGEDISSSSGATAPRRLWQRRKPEAPKPVPPAAPLRVLAVQPLSGGAGATTFTVNVAAALAIASPGREICLIDLDLQGGGATSHLDVTAGPRILDAYRDLQKMDGEVFSQCLVPVRAGLRILPAPAEILPLDIIAEGGIGHLITLALGKADLVVLDMPLAITDWTANAFSEADLIVALGQLNIRSASKLRRLRRLIPAEVMSADRLVPILNRAPRHPDRHWLSARAGFVRGHGLDPDPVLSADLPDGEGAVARAADGGLTLAELDPENPYCAAVDRFCQAVSPRIMAANNRETLQGRVG